MRKYVAILSCVMLAGCQALSSADAAVTAFVAKNNAAITNACNNDILPVVNDPAVQIIGAAVGPVAQAAASLGGLCKDAEAIGAAAQSITTLPWAATELTVIKSKGTILPPPVAPVPATASTIPAAVPTLTVPTSS